MAFFGFKRMVSPFFLSLVYFVGLIGIVLVTVGALYKAPILVAMQQTLPINDKMMFGVYGAIILTGILAILLWRFVIELQIVLFGIFNRLDEIRIILETESHPPSQTNLRQHQPSDHEEIATFEPSSSTHTLADEKSISDHDRKKPTNILQSLRTRRRR